MTQLTEGDRMALLSEWVPIENAYRQALERQDERSDVLRTGDGTTGEDGK